MNALAHSTLIRNATIVTMNDARAVVDGSVSVRDRRIASVGQEPDVDRQVEAVTMSLEVLVEFPPCSVYRLRRTEDA